jgi:hypothetical protein
VITRTLKREWKDRTQYTWSLYRYMPHPRPFGELPPYWAAPYVKLGLQQTALDAIRDTIDTNIRLTSRCHEKPDLKHCTGDPHQFAVD